MTLRFVHTSDIHLGKAFGPYAEGARLTEARFRSLGRLVEVAREHDAPHVLIAGDLFETPNPAPFTWRQAVTAMADAADVKWWLLPGNHDNLREASATWEAIAARGHANIRCLTEPAPVRMAEGAILLPSPVGTRRPGSDPTGWLDAAAPEAGLIRVGLAHGPIHGFSETDASPGVIAPDRDRRSSLDYLALGDWHGRMRVSDRTWYSGAPELDRFKHDGRGGCLVVGIAGPNAAPEVIEIDIGQFAWHDVALSLLPEDDAAGALDRALPAGARRDMLVRVRSSGRTSLSGHAALTAAAEHAAPEFCHFACDTDGLSLERDVDDLDEIAASGALRQAAGVLFDEAADAALSSRDRAVSEAALRRLYGLVSEGGA